MTSISSSVRRKRVLVVHGLTNRSRGNSVLLTKSFSSYSRGIDFHYINILGFTACQESYEEYDLAVVTSDALSLRSYSFWPDLESRLVRLLGKARRKVLLTQDEYTFSERIDTLATKSRVDAMWAVVSDDLGRLFPNTYSRGVRFEHCLTGYVDDEHDTNYVEFTKDYSTRKIDLGQRVSTLPLIFGESGRRKAEIATLLAEEFEVRGFNVDVSTDPSQVLLGDEWIRFLGDTKFTVSRKGGSSIADRAGYMFESLERINALLPRLPENLKARLVSKRKVLFGSWTSESPRLFEAAALGVCQILEEDVYLNGDMQPWIHYLPLKSDFSNVVEIMDFISSEERVRAVISAARKLLVESHSYSYRTFVQAFLTKEIESYHELNQSPSVTIDMDFRSQADFDAAKIAITTYFSETGIIRLLRDLFSPKPPSSMVLYRELNALELLPEVFTESWMPVSRV